MYRAVRLHPIVSVLPVVCLIVGCGRGSVGGGLTAATATPTAFNPGPGPSVLSAVVETPCKAEPGGHSTAFLPQPGVTYMLLEASADRALTIPQNSMAVGTNLATQPRINGINQLFTFDTSATFVSSIPSALELRIYHSNQWVDRGTDGALQQGEQNGNTVVWRLVPRVGGYALVDQATKLCATVKANGSQVFRVHPFKKGLAVHGDGWVSEVAQLQPAFIYDWGSSTNARVPAAVEFVPMIWGYYGNASALQALLDKLAKNGARTILAYNEPDNPSQANLDPNVAASTWGLFENSGMQTGSPAAMHAEDAWMQTFFNAIGGPQHVRFLAVHYYGGVSVDAFISYLTALHNQYGLPIWITEFCPADWNATSVDEENFTPAQAEAFLRDLLPRLDALPWVQRFFYFNPGAAAAALGHSALYNSDGTLSGAGKVYQAYPLTAP